MFEKLDEKRLQISFFKFTPIVNLKNFASESWPAEKRTNKTRLPKFGRLCSETIAVLK